MSAEPFPVEYLRCVKVHPSIEVVREEEGVEEGDIVTADAVIVTLISLGG